MANLIDMFSEAARERLATVVAAGPFTSTEAFADAARRIAGETKTMTSDHIFAVCCLVAIEAKIDAQSTLVLALALDTVRQSLDPAEGNAPASPVVDST